MTEAELSRNEREDDLSNYNVYGKLSIGDAYDSRSISLYCPIKNAVDKKLTFHSLPYIMLNFKFLNDHYLAFSADDGNIHVVRIEGGKYEDIVLKGHISSTQGLDYWNVGGGKAILVSCCMGGLIRVWDVGTWKCLQSFRAHRGTTRNVKFLNENTVFTTAMPKELKKWDIEKCECVQTSNLGYYWDFNVLKGRKIFAGACYGNDFNRGNKVVSFLDTENLTCLDKVDVDHPVYAIRQIENGKVIVGTNRKNGNEIYRFDVRKFLKEKSALYPYSRRETGGIKGIEDLKDKECFATNSEQGNLYIWDYELNLKEKLKMENKCYGMSYISQWTKDSLMANKDTKERLMYIENNFKPFMIKLYSSTLLVPTFLLYKTE